MPENRIVGCVIMILLLMPFMAGAQTKDAGEHKVVRGDTLWDISKQELKDPFLWPEVWKRNPEIKNPHRIYPDQIIRLPLDLIEGQKKGGEGMKAATGASREDAAVVTEPEKTEKGETFQKSPETSKKPVAPVRRFADIKGIILYNGTVIEGEILSMTAETVVIRTENGTVRSYSFEDEIEDFIRE